MVEGTGIPGWKFGQIESSSKTNPDYGFWSYSSPEQNNLNSPIKLLDCIPGVIIKGFVLNHFYFCYCVKVYWPGRGLWRFNQPNVLKEGQPPFMLFCSYSLNLLLKTVRDRDPTNYAVLPLHFALLSLLWFLLFVLLCSLWTRRTKQSLFLGNSIF